MQQDSQAARDMVIARAGKAQPVRSIGNEFWTRTAGEYAEPFEYFSDIGSF